MLHTGVVEGFGPNRPLVIGAAEHSRIVYGDVRSPASCHHVLACSTEIGRPLVHQVALSD